MIYNKVSVIITPYSKDASDLLIALMGDIGYDSFEENDFGFDGYIVSKDFNNGLLNNITIPMQNISFTYSVEEIPDQNWNEVWEKNYFQPIIIENQCVVRGPFHPNFPETPYQIVIEPKMAFGTGHHETTGLMIRYILDTSVENKRVLDMGCGTGILGILASMRGAVQVIGVDIDQWSFENTVENCNLNFISNMKAYCGDASLLDEMEPFDCIFANINRNILLNDISSYSKKLSANGLLFLSGFYNNDLAVIKDEASKNGLSYLSKKEDNNWIAALFIKSY
ncbi:MAG: 50S ribosomal protein L11 methyltransferase [Marinilabiliaceae bacterium]|nr:50S ribosomal protein L11 methyltransferase [Marinilabiliaceae bacterium]